MRLAPREEILTLIKLIHLYMNLEKLVFLENSDLHFGDLNVVDGYSHPFIVFFPNFNVEQLKVDTIGRSLTIYEDRSKRPTSV